MKVRAWVSLVVCAPAVLVGAFLLRAGPLDPPAGPVSSTMKTLEQVEPRTPIGQPAVGGFPIVINQPGSYYLTQAITGVSGQNGVVIAADDVTLDLNGFALVGGGNSTGIEAGAGRQRISVRNGTVRAWGVGVLASTATSVRFADLVVAGSVSSGILGGSDTMVSRCVVSNNGDRGIQITSGLVSDCEARSNNIGISVTDGVVRGCTASGNTTGIVGIRSVVENAVASNNTGDGIFGSSGQVRNCVVRANNGDGIECIGECIVTGNVCTLNGAGALVGAGIHCTGDRNHIEGNNVMNNDVGIDTSDIGVENNVVVRNTASCNTTANYETDANDQVGTIGTLTTIGNNPWGNVSMNGFCS